MRAVTLFQQPTLGQYDSKRRRLTGTGFHQFRIRTSQVDAAIIAELLSKEPKLNCIEIKPSRKDPLVPAINLYQVHEQGKFQTEPSLVWRLKITRIILNLTALGAGDGYSDYELLNNWQNENFECLSNWFSFLPNLQHLQIQFEANCGINPLTYQLWQLYYKAKDHAKFRLSKPNLKSASFAILVNPTKEVFVYFTKALAEWACFPYELLEIIASYYTPFP